MLDELRAVLTLDKGNPFQTDLLRWDAIAFENKQESQGRRFAFCSQSDAPEQRSKY